MAKFVRRKKSTIISAFIESMNEKETENGDRAFLSTGNNLLDILFLTDYFTKHLDEACIGDSDREKLFAKFIRDPRYGMGRRDLGRKLLRDARVSLAEIAKCGRYDDIWNIFKWSSIEFDDAIKFLRCEIENGNELAKKWMPRFGSKDKIMASRIAKAWGMTKQQYGKFIKTATTEQKLTLHHEDDIKFDQVPSLASIKYAKLFSTKETTKERYAKYVEDVKSGKAKLNVSVTTPYDIYRNMDKIDADMFFDKLPKISLSALVIADTSGSMHDRGDSFGKCLALGHYISKCSTYMNGYVVPFSSRPVLMKISDKEVDENAEVGYYLRHKSDSKYYREIRSMYTGDCSNTDFAAVMNIMKKVDGDEMPEFLIVLSDMEFDTGSNQATEEVEEIWRLNGCKTKIVWWNLSEGDNKTVPEIQENGNIYMSGYNPTLLKFLEAGFDGERYLNKLLEEYKKKIEV